MTDTFPESPPPPPPAGWSATVEPSPPPGPAVGLAYAGVGRRIVAYIIDLILASIAVGVLTFIVVIPIILSGTSTDLAVFLVLEVLAAVIFGLYFILAWRQRRATLGQLLLGLIVGNQDDGARLTWSAAFIRWLVLTLGPIPAVIVFLLPSLSSLASLLQFGWIIVLLVTTATSPTKQGLHDRWSRSLVVRRA